MRNESQSVVGWGHENTRIYHEYSVEQNIQKSDPEKIQIFIQILLKCLVERRWREEEEEGEGTEGEKNIVGGSPIGLDVLARFLLPATWVVSAIV